MHCISSLWCTALPDFDCNSSLCLHKAQIVVSACMPQCCLSVLAKRLPASGLMHSLSCPLCPMSRLTEPTSLCLHAYLSRVPRSHPSTSVLQDTLAMPPPPAPLPNRKPVRIHIFPSFLSQHPQSHSHDIPMPAGCGQPPSQARQKGCSRCAAHCATARPGELVSISRVWHHITPQTLHAPHTRFYAPQLAANRAEKRRAKVAAAARAAATEPTTPPMSPRARHRPAASRATTQVPSNHMLPLHCLPLSCCSLHVRLSFPCLLFRRHLPSSHCDLQLPAGSRRCAVQVTDMLKAKKPHRAHAPGIAPAPLVGPLSFLHKHTSAPHLRPQP